MAPYIAIRTFVFPFAEGLDFAVQLFQSAGNWSLINQALETPPASTEQVLHLEKFAAGEMPISVEMPDLGRVLGGGWKHVRTGVLGELFITAWLETDFSPQAASIAATGWGGDAYSLFEGLGRPGRPRPRDGLGLRARRRRVLLYRSATHRGPLRRRLGGLGNRDGVRFSDPARPYGLRRAKGCAQSAHHRAERRTR